ncbi:46 kDa FK506-binding nuclear protein-like isoform X2 [Dreissena polymorpha]|nr:46 kDa FK506-binding nuclear protein-like isoform X2 [Dreissena polymorpha]
MAVIEMPADADSHKKSTLVSVMGATDKGEFLLCYLNHSSVFQQALDLNFNEGENVTFYINGQGTVHLTGYQMEDEDYDDMIMDEESGDSEEEAPELVSPGNKRKNAAEPNKKNKKLKWMTPGGTEGSDDSEDDSEDEDFEIAEEDDDDDDEDDDDVEDFLDMEAEEDEEEEEDEDEEEEDEEEEDVEEETLPKKKKQQATPPLEKAQKKNKTLDKETPGKTTPGKDKQQQNKKTPAKETPQPKGNGQQGKSPVSTPAGPGGDAEAGQSAKKKKKKKKKKNKQAENTPEANGDSQQNKSVTQTTNQTPKSVTPAPKGETQTPKDQKKTPKKQVLALGTVMEEIKEGDGPVVKKGQMAHVYYVGKLQKDGKQFDSCTGGKPFRFRIGKGEVIKGWDVGVEGMKVGGKRRLTVPPQAGYGNQRQGPIPPNSTLVFEVELKNAS